jgi:hypothetical protein
VNLSFVTCPLLLLPLTLASCCCGVCGFAALREAAVVVVVAVAYCRIPIAECLPFDTLGKRVSAVTPKMHLFGLRMVVSDA